MQPEPLHAYVKGRIIDEASDDEQRDLLKVILHSCGTKRKNEKSSEPATIPCGDLEVANKLFSSRKCLPKIYCYLAFCLKILEISAKGKRDWSSTARLWGYMFWSASDAEALADFTQACWW